MQISRRRFLRVGIGAGATALLGSYPVFIERYLVMVNKYRIPVPRLPESFEGFTIVQLTDLHYGFLVPMSLIGGVVDRANSIPRDITVCTGDYIHERNADGQIQSVWPVLGRLMAPFGVFSVLGNHDHWGDTKSSLNWLDKTGQNLRHSARRLERNGEYLWLVGAGDLWEDHMSVEFLMKDIPTGDCRIILAHNPDTADTVFDDKADLFISGHTHGGQVNIPFIGTPVLPVKNKDFSFGLKNSKTGHSVFISRGIGWAIYPVRFNCFPEIAVLTLTRDTGAAV